jgi:hexosaminidase
VNPVPDSRYAGNGAGTLIDGIKGTPDLSDQRWRGFQGTDVEVTIDLRERKQVEQITMGCLHNSVAWVLLPKRIRLSVSEDGGAFKAAAVVDVAPPAAEKPGVRYTTLLHSPIQVRYLKIHVESPGVLNAWHSAAGRSSWLFLDEVQIQ